MEDCSFAEECILFGQRDGLYIALEFYDFYRISPERSTIRIIAVGDDFVVDARHVFTGEEDREHFMQCLPRSMNAGLNFKQHLYFSEEEILAGKDKEPVYKPPGPMLIFLEDGSAHDLAKIPYVY